MSVADIEPDDALNGPVGQSIGIGFRVLQLGTALLAIVWATSNIRPTPPDMQALTLRFGRVVDVRPAGLVLAWPRPFEHVELVPRAERQLNMKVEASQAFGLSIIDPASRASGETVPESAGLFLAGDGGLVLLDASLTYRVTEPVAYYLQSAHVEPALRRLFLASAADVAAGRSIDDFLVVRSAGDAGQEARRQALRGALVDEVNRRLKALEGRHAGLGVEIVRADIAAYLPPAAKFAFDAVLEASQMADQGLASARTDAARIGQAADHERDRLLTAARASADERIGAARSNVAAITALETKMDPASRPSLIDQLYRERIGTVLRQAGHVSTVDMRGGSRLILPGGNQ